MQEKLLLISNSRAYGRGYLDHCDAEIRGFLGGLDRVLFVPYARPSGIGYDEYTQIARQKFEQMGYLLDSIHEADNPKGAVERASAIFIGGGNTFVLLNELYKEDVLKPIRQRVEGGMPYLGASAGVNVACPTIMTTNDMPIVYPPSFHALSVIPFQINPHFIDRDLSSTHQGETRETRLCEYQVFNDSPVIGLREGAILRVDWPSILLKGKSGARLFMRDQVPVDCGEGTRFDFLVSSDSVRTS